MNSTPRTPVRHQLMKSGNHQEAIGRVEDFGMIALQGEQLEKAC